MIFIFLGSRNTHAIIEQLSKEWLVHAFTVTMATIIGTLSVCGLLFAVMVNIWDYVQL